MKGKVFRSYLLLLLITTTVTSVVRFIPLSSAYTGTNVYIDPALVERYTNTTSVGDTFTVALKFGNFTDLAGIEYKLFWDNSVLELIGIADTLPWPSYFTGANVTDNNWNATHGRSYFVAVDTSGTPFTGSATLRQMTFNITSMPPAGYGNYLYSLIDIRDTIFADPSATPIPHTVYDGEFYLTNPGPVASFTYSPAEPKIDETVTFNASSSYVAGGGTIVSYDWYFGDGNVTAVATPTITHVYTAVGNYTVTLYVTDDQARIGSTAANITVSPLTVPPVASFTYSPLLIKINTTVTFNASASYDPDGSIVDYSWDFGDGNVTAVATPIITHVYTAEGNYTVTLNVTDNDGLWDAFSLGITVWPAQIPPFASFTYSPSIPQPNSTTTFNATDSYDLDGTVVSYSWDFGDGNVTAVATPIITHVYTAEGNYTVTLNVTDNDGLFGVFSLGITVRIVIPPIADFTYSPSLPSLNYTTTFDASASSDPDGTIELYSWDFGDGDTTVTNETTTTHVYTATGNYTVTLTVTDNDGLNDTISKQITVWPSIAWLEIQPSTRLVLSEEFEININIKNLGEDWHLFGIQFKVSYDSTLLELVSVQQGPFLESFPWTTSPPYTYLFTYPNTGYVTVATGLLDGGAEPPGYIYPNGEGTVVTIRFRTTANVQLFKSYPLPFDIYDVLFGDVSAAGIPSYDSLGANYYIRIDPPVPTFNYKPSGPVTGETVTFNASASYDTSPFDNGTIVSYLWDFGDGSNGTGMIATHAYAEPGTYDVTLTVTDNDGNSRSITKTITISRWYLDVAIDVGSIYFRGEIAQFYIQTSLWGTPVDVGSMTATLYYGSQKEDVTSLIERLDIGLYRINYTVSATASEGTWLLVAKAMYLSLAGTAMEPFQISSTLTSWNAQIISINNGVATIQTDTRIIRSNLTDLNAEIIDVKDGVATISTDLGLIRDDLTDLNAEIVEVKDGIATIDTDLGTIMVDLDDLEKTKLPTDTGTIASVLYVTIILSAISAIAAIILIYRLVLKGKQS